MAIMSVLDRWLRPRRRERMVKVTNAEVKINRAESRLLDGLDIRIETHEEQATGDSDEGSPDAGTQPNR